MLHLISGPTDTRAADSSAQGVRKAFLVSFNMLFYQKGKLYSIKIRQQINLELSSQLSPEADLAPSGLMSSTVRYPAVLLVVSSFTCRLQWSTGASPRSSPTFPCESLAPLNPLNPRLTPTASSRPQYIPLAFRPLAMQPKLPQIAPCVLQNSNVQLFLANLATESNVTTHLFFSTPKKANEPSNVTSDNRAPEPTVPTDSATGSAVVAFLPYDDLITTDVATCTGSTLCNYY